MKAIEFLKEETTREEVRDAHSRAELQKEIDELNGMLSGAEAAVRKSKDITRGVQDLESVHSVIVEITMLADSLGIPAKDYRYEINAIYEKERELEAAVYTLEDIFTGYLENINIDLERLHDEIEGYEEGGIGIDEAKKGRRAMKYNSKPRTGHAPTQTGAGAHKDKTKEIPRHQKHKTVDVVGEQGMSENNKYPFAGAKVGQKAGPTGQLKGRDPGGKYPRNKLVGGD